MEHFQPACGEQSLLQQRPHSHGCGLDPNFEQAQPQSPVLSAGLVSQCLHTDLAPELLLTAIWDFSMGLCCHHVDLLSAALIIRVNCSVHPAMCEDLASPATSHFCWLWFTAFGSFLLIKFFNNLHGYSGVLIVQTHSTVSHSSISALP